MTYIINPAWVYWISVADTLRLISIIIVALSTCGTVVGLVTIGANRQWDDDDYEMGKAIFKVSLSILIVSVLAAAFIPSKETLVGIQVAKLATYENAELTVDALKSAVDYIVESIKSLK